MKNFIKNLIQRITEFLNKRLKKLFVKISNF